MFTVKLQEVEDARVKKTFTFFVFSRTFEEFKLLYHWTWSVDWVNYLRISVITAKVISRWFIITKIMLILKIFPELTNLKMDLKSKQKLDAKLIRFQVNKYFKYDLFWREICALYQTVRFYWIFVAFQTNQANRNKWSVSKSHSKSPGICTGFNSWQIVKNWSFLWFIVVWSN